MARSRLGLSGEQAGAFSFHEVSIGNESIASGDGLTVTRLHVGTHKGIVMPCFGVTSPGYAYGFEGAASFIREDKPLIPAGNREYSEQVLGKGRLVRDLVSAVQEIELVRALVFTRKQVAVMTESTIPIRTSTNSESRSGNAKVWASDVLEAISGLGIAKLAIFGLSQASDDAVTRRYALRQAEFRGRVIPSLPRIVLSPANQIRQQHGLPLKDV